MKPSKILFALCAAAAVAVNPLAIAESPDDCGLMHHHGRPDLTRMLTRTLNLTDAQQTQVKTMVAEVQPQLDAIHQQARQAADVVMKQLNAKVRPLLTADQQKRLDALETLHTTESPAQPAAE
jgi:Spy/CpxP family protein refolding chaperone